MASEQVSYNRLKNKGIFCSHNRAVAAAGRINCLCFDKTGTLTEDGLTLKGVHVVEPNGKLGEPIERSDDLYKVESGKGHEMSNHRLMALVMAACHSVSILEPEDLPQPTKSVSKNGSDSPTPTTEMNTCDMDESGIKLLTFKALKRKLTGGKSGFQHESLDDSAHLTNPSMSFQERFVGDSLEVQMFLHSGWRYVPRPAQGQQVMKSQGQWDSSVVWSRGDVDQMVDTVLLPPMMISEEPTSFALSVLRRLDFDADLRRMGVVVQRLHSKAGRVLDNGKVLLVLKGAPEGMLDICKPDTIPSNFHERLDQLAGEGFRVLGCAARWMDKAEAETASRLDIEKGMTFLGFMSMENPLKKETVRFLKLYSYAAMRICMITGDNPQTAAAVGRMAGTFINEKSTTTLLVDFENKALTLTSMTDSTVKFPLLSYLLAHFNEDEILIPPKFNPFFPKGNQAVSLGPHDLVVTGKAFEVLLKASTNSRKDEKVDGVHWTPLELVLSKANIYARMSPQHKQDLVNALQDMNLVVAMTGDGANDSQALKAADIGISIAAKEAVDLDSSGAGNISKEEAAALAAPSIAAPFATGVHHIGAVSMVLTEGRCALLTSVTMFKYMFLYGLIQFTGVMILYYLLLELTDSQYLWADMGVVLGFVTLVPMMEPKLYVSFSFKPTNVVLYIF